MSDYKKGKVPNLCRSLGTSTAFSSTRAPGMQPTRENRFEASYQFNS